MSDSPRTPLRSLGAGGEDCLRLTPGGLSMEIVLTPALRPPPSKSTTCSPITPLNERLSNAEARREEFKKLRKENIDEKLASVQSKKEEMMAEKTKKIKEELENKMKASEESRDAIIKKTKEDVHAYLTKVEQKVKELEISTEAAKIAMKISLDANCYKVEENREELQDHEDYVKQVIANQERKKKQYLTNLELSLEKASKRKENQIAKIVEDVKVEDVKIAEAKERRFNVEKELQEKVSCAIKEKFSKVEELLSNKEDDLRTKIEEKNRRMEQVKQNKLNLVPESA